LVTDGNERAALAVTRALGQHHVEVIVGSETDHSLAGASKYCTHSFVYPSPHTSAAPYLQCLLDTVRSERADAVFPISDIAMHVIGPRRAEFQRYTAIPIPDYEMFRSISDKYDLMRQAMALGIPIPETIFVPQGRVEPVLDQIAAFPVVVKPGCSLVKRENGWQKARVHYADSPDDLIDLYRRHQYLQGPSLIQRRVEGQGKGLFVLMNQGVPLGMFAHKRLREKPPSGGVSVLRESIPLDKQLTDPALRLLQRVHWHGVAMVEFKEDRTSEVPLLMEVNGRFWGSLQLAIDAGINFPWLLLQMATGQQVGVPENGYRCGVKSRWLLGDLDHLLMRLFKPEVMLNLPPGACSKWKCVRDFARFFQRDTVFEVERFHDMGPVIHEFKSYIGVHKDKAC
jgi:predicted ATP-grasp superfamily ATP-dependent carboligase